MSDSDITIIGNLTRDPEADVTLSGTPVTRLGVAVNRRWKKAGDDDFTEEVSFFNVTAWRDLGANATCLTKGTRVIIKGRLQQRTWETDEGEKRSAVDIVADDIAASLRWATVDVTKVVKEKVGGDRPPIADEEPF